MRIIPGDYSHGPNDIDATSPQNSSSSTTTPTTSDQPQRPQFTTTPENSQQSNDNNNSNLPHDNGDDDIVALQSLEQQLSASDNWDVPSVDRAFDALPSAIKYIQTDLDNNISLDEIQSHWTNFLNTLATRFPESVEHINKMQDVTTNFDKKEDWEELLTIIKNGISNVQQQPQQGSTETQHQDQASW